MKLYEAMIILDGAVAERDYGACTAAIESIIKKHGGNIVDLRKWDDRRLVYEIRRAKRGTYVLVHFEAPPSAIETLRRDFVLSEKILRHLITIDIDGVPTGDERPGITTTSVPDFLDRRPREGRPDGPAGDHVGPAADEVAVPGMERM